MPKCRSGRRRERACNRGIPSPGTLAGDSFRPEERRLRREGAIVFCPCLLLVLPPIARATRRGRRVCAPSVPMGRCRCGQVWSVLECALPSKHIRAAVVAARPSYHAGHVGHLYPSSHCRGVRDEIQLSWRFQSTNNAKARSYTRARGDKQKGCCAPPCASTSRRASWPRPRQPASTRHDVMKPRRDG